MPALTDSNQLGQKVRSLTCATCLRVPSAFRFGRILYSQTEDVDRKVVDHLGEIAEQRGVSRAQLALAWLLSKAAITAPVVGATKLNHLEEAVAALSLRLTPEEVAALEEPYIPHSIVGFS